MDLYLNFACLVPHNCSVDVPRTVAQNKLHPSFGIIGQNINIEPIVEVNNEFGVVSTLP